MRRPLLLSAVLSAAVGCQNGNQLATSPPLFPQDLPVNIEPPTLENLTLPRPPLLQTTLLGAKLANAPQTDDFQQTPALLDVLWVVSNAGVMADERDRLAANVQAFTTVLTNAQVTWQIAVTSSDLSYYLLPDGTLHIGDGGKLHGPVPIITPSDPTFQQDFTAALTWTIQRDSAPSQTSIFASMKLALDAAGPGGANAGLLRPGASLAVIAAANNDDESFGEVGYFARYLKSANGPLSYASGTSAAGNEQLVTFSAFGGPASGECSPPGQSQLFGAQVAPTPRLQGLTTATGGENESICDEAAFGSALTQIAENIKTLRRYFSLSAPPDPSSILVTVNGAAVAQDPQDGWQYLANINTVAFLGAYVPDPGADVRITYTVTLQ